MSFKCALVGICRCWTMTVTMPLPSVVGCWSSGENLWATAALAPVRVLIVLVNTLPPPPQTTDAPWDSVVSLFSFWLAPAKDGTAESISSATPSARPQAALNAGELSGRPSRPLVICDVSLLLFIISFCRWPCEGRDINHDLVPGL